jgi:hypothetical protein
MKTCAVVDVETIKTHVLCPTNLSSAFEVFDVELTTVLQALCPGDVSQPVSFIAALKMNINVSLP